MMTENKKEVPATLVDIDWQIGVVTASNVPDMKGRTYLQLKLFLEKGADTEGSILTELEISTFYKLFHILKKASLSIDEYV